MARSLRELLLFGFLAVQVWAKANGKAATVVLETAHHLSPEWHWERAADDQDSVMLSVALKQPQLEILRASMLQRAEAGHHLPQSQLQFFQEPDRDGVKAVQEWLQQNGVHRSRQSGAWVSFNITVGEARRLFKADLSFFSFGHASPLLRTKSYSIPTSLTEYVDFVYPLAHFMTPMRSRPRPHLSARSIARATPERANATNCAQNEVTPACLKEIYNWNYTAPTGDSPSRLAIAGFLDEFINYQDVADFTRKYLPEKANLRPPYNFTVELIANGTNPQSPRWKAGMEASLDVQWALALAYPANIIYYSTGGRGVKLDPSGEPYPTAGSDNEPYMELFDHFLSLPDDKIPHVLSISYADDEQTVPAPYAHRVCDMLLQLAARGVTVLAATGDGGSAGVGRTDCVSNDGTQTRMLLPTFPASCPWVTAVGATSNQPLSEGAAYSTGGFSNLFQLPEWQRKAAKGYMSALNGSKAGLYNASGRGSPDISAIGSEFAVIWGNGPAQLTGTSASTPVVASMLALVNDARLRAGKNVTGWLNPTLYSAEFQGVLEDVVQGVSKGCRFTTTQSEPGWPALSGWDCVTGLGVPGNLRKFMDALIGPPAHKGGAVR